MKKPRPPKGSSEHQCDKYHRDLAEWEQWRLQQKRSRWTPAGSQPPFAGTVEGTQGGYDNIVSFKTRDDQDRTLIADGDYRDDPEGFDENHNDYGRKREGGGFFAKDDGHYTGPGH